jgi:hypothetical protein
MALLVKKYLESLYKSQSLLEEINQVDAGYEIIASLFTLKDVNDAIDSAIL